MCALPPLEKFFTWIILLVRSASPNFGQDSGFSCEATQDSARRFQIEYNLRFLWDLICHNFKIGRSAASMAALRAGASTDKSRSRYVKTNPPWEVDFFKISDRAEKGSNRRLSSQGVRRWFAFTYFLRPCQRFCPCFDS